MTAREQPMHDEQYRITLDIPPMSAIYLKPRNIRDPHAVLETEDKAENAKSEPTQDVPEANRDAPETKAAEDVKAEEKASEAAASPAPKPAPANNNQNRNAKRKGKHKR